jgi:hypothetical protein
VTSDYLDGSAGAEPVSFGLDGVSYEIGLAPPSKTRLRGHGRCVNRRRAHGQPRRPESRAPARDDTR